MWTLLFTIATIAAPSSCVCNKVPRPDAPRPDYGTLCASWDAADEAPWCSVASATACGAQATRKSEAGHFWSHAPCEGKARGNHDHYGSRGASMSTSWWGKLLELLGGGAACPAGTFDDRNGTCTACAAGRFSDKPTGNKACAACPYGQTSQDESFASKGRPGGTRCEPLLLRKSGATPTLANLTVPERERLTKERFGISPQKSAVHLQHLKAVGSALDKASITWWLACGTLLSACRGGVVPSFEVRVLRPGRGSHAGKRALFSPSL